MYTNGSFTGTYKQCCDHMNASLPRNHPENWPDGPWTTVQPEPVAPTAEQLLSRLEYARKAAEDEGVTVNGVRYSGSPSNRQALADALQAAAEFGLTTFGSWRDSDGGYHADHPVADVQEALRQIGLRRMQLIALEGQYAQHIEASEITTIAEIEALEWTV